MMEVKAEQLKKKKSTRTTFSLQSLRSKILTDVNNAGSPKQLESFIRAKRRDPEMQKILVEAIGCAAARMDYDIHFLKKKSNGETEDIVVHKGMMEVLLALHYELFPAKHSEALAEAQRAAPLENKEERETREKNNITKMKNFLDVFEPNTKHDISAEITAFIDSVKLSKPDFVTDNQYYSNVLHLIYIAYDMFNKELKLLLKYYDQITWKEKLESQFYPFIALLEDELPVRIQQLLLHKLKLVFSEKQNPINRSLDVDVVGRAVAYGHNGANIIDGEYLYLRGSDETTAEYFLQLINSNDISIENALYPPQDLAAVPELTLIKSCQNSG